MHLQRRKVFTSSLMLVGSLLFVLFTTWPAQAAIELVYFRATVSANAVLLEWATAQEFNVSGFVIECKRTDEPPSAYHPIGARNAQGGPTQGAQYSFNVAAGLEPGVSYCFKLVERTTDGVPGEEFELCGYGLSITPEVASGLGVETPVTVIVVPPPGLATSTPVTPLEPVATPTATLPVVTPPESPLPPQPESPLEGLDTESPDVEEFGFPQEPEGEEPDGEDVDPSGNSDLLDDDLSGSENDVNAAQAGESNSPDHLTEEPAGTATPEQADSPLNPPEESPTPNPNENSSNENSTEEAVVAGIGVGMEATPTPLYVVVTATPTPEQLAAAAPTFTPWPTVTPVPEFQLTNWLAPSTQNMMVMLLCLIFLTASGLGTLGLVTSVIYMRSRAQREQYLDRLTGRRRF